MNDTTSNKDTISLVIRCLTVLAFMCVFTTCLMSGYGIKIPPELNTLTGGLVGALTAMLVKTSPTETVKQKE